ncbi:MAG: translation initiation factor IF-2 [Nitrososphaerales archaeon]
MTNQIRQPVVVVLGHVDSGKTSLLDKIRGTAVQAREVGGMTQHIGASFFPIETLKQICGPLLASFKAEIRLPGLLVIDTPGHEVFANLRSRGGSAADLAILVIDILKGFEVQTYESVEILRSRKVPFVVALNKIDLIPGWRSGNTPYFTNSLKIQDDSVIKELDEKIYNVVGSFSRLNFKSEAFYRVRDFTKEIAIVPVSAKTGEGIPELMAILIGLAQQYLTKRLTLTSKLARGITLEVKEEMGLGYTANVILLDGTLKVGDTVVLGKRDGAVVTKVKALFMPKPLDEMRDPRDKFTPVEFVSAAAGVKLITQDLEGVLAGTPLFGVETSNDIKEAIKSIESEVKRVFINTDNIGVIVKADTLGSLEAIVEMLKRRNVPIRIADIGPVTRRDIIEASTVAKVDPYLGVVLTFGVKLLPDAEDEAAKYNIRVFSDPIVYNLIQSYLDWVTKEKEAAERLEFMKLTPPCKFRILKGYVFRRSNPAIFGIEVLYGRLKQKVTVMNENGKTIGTVHQIQDKGENINEAYAGSQVAISMMEPIVGRQIHEGEILYTLPDEADVKLLKSKYMHRLSEDEVKVLDEIIKIRRKVNPLYGF